MPIAFYASYGTLDRAHLGGQAHHGAKRSGIYRIYRRLDNQYEIRSHVKQPVPQNWELVASCEFNPATGDWIQIYP